MISSLQKAELLLPNPTPSEGVTETPGPSETNKPTDPSTPEGVIATVDTSALTPGTVYDAATPISDVVSVGVASVGGVSVVEDGDRGNVLKLEDGGEGQTSLKFDLSKTAAVAEEEATLSAVNGIIRYNVGYKFEVAEADLTVKDILKDLTLLRLSNNDYAATLPVATDDGRVVEITTNGIGTDTYQIVVKDYYLPSSKDATRPESKTTSISLKANAWYDLSVEVDSNTNIIKIYAKNADGMVIGADQVTLGATTSAPIAVTNASVTTKGGNTATTTLYVDSPEFSTADTSMELPEVDDSNVPWTYGVNKKVISSSTMINFSESGSVYDVANLEVVPAHISKTISWGDITVYMDADRDLEWQDNGGTIENHGGSGNGGMMEYSQRKYPVGEYITNFNMSIAGNYSSLFEGMMAKTADGSPVYLIKDEDGAVRRELRIREIDEKNAIGASAYDKNGNAVDLNSLPAQTETFTDPFEKVIGVKVSGPCEIGVVSAANGGRCLMISTADGTILNPNADPSYFGTVPEVDSNTGISWVNAQYTGDGPTEIFISCQGGGLCVNAIDIVFPEE